MKFCHKCKIHKEKACFSKSTRNHDGLNYTCRLCRKAEKRSYYLKHKEKILAKCSIKRNANKEQIKIYRKNYRINYPERYWASKTLSYHRSKYTIMLSLSALTALAKISNTCNFCGCRLDYSAKLSKKLELTSPTLDRLNNSNILTIDTIQILCHSCNTIKQDRTQKEFVDYCRGIVKRFYDPETF